MTHQTTVTPITSLNPLHKNMMMHKCSYHTNIQSLINRHLHTRHILIQLALRKNPEQSKPKRKKPKRKNPERNIPESNHKPA